MLKNIAQILSLKAFRVRHDDPRVHYSTKIGSKPFMVVIIGHQQVKYAKARLRKGQLELSKSNSVFVDNFSSSEQETAWVSDMLAEAGDCKDVLIGINCIFSHLKVYPKDTKIKDVTKAMEANLEEEVGKSFEKMSQYFVSQAGFQLTLNGVERDKIAKPMEKFKKWGFNVLGVFHYPTAVIAKAATMSINWTSPGVLVYYTQKLLFIVGWTDSEVTQLKSRLFAEAVRNPTGAKPLLNAIQREIDSALSFINAKAPGATVNVYIYHDKQDQALTGLEGLYKNSQIFAWSNQDFITDIKDYPDPDLAVINDTELPA